MVDGFRERLAWDLLPQPDMYKLKIDRDIRKALRLMKSHDQLPCVVVLIAACRLYDIKESKY